MGLIRGNTLAPLSCQSYLNLRLMHRDENMQVVPLWATAWQQTPEGVFLTLDPQAKWQDGTPATAEDVKANIEALMGQYAPAFKGTPRLAYMKRLVEEVQVIDPTHVFIKTRSSDPTFLPTLGGANYHLLWFGPSAYLKQVGHDGYVKKPLGGGPYKIKEFKAGDRIVWERWEDFWGQAPYWKKPQHRSMEWIQVPDDAARFAMLKGKQVDMVVNIPYAIAKALPRSEAGQRGVNPQKGALWTQTMKASGKMQITFDAEFVIKEKLAGWEALQQDPTLNPKVREALELAIDKRAIVDNFHYGFTSLNQSLYSLGSFGWRREQGEKNSPYDPKRAKELLREAGYPEGFSTTIHFGVFTGRPGQPEALEAIASYWKDIGVELTIVQHDPTEFYTRLNRPDRAYRPMTLVTWGRQENGEYIAEQAASAGGGGQCITSAPMPCSRNLPTPSTRHSDSASWLRSRTRCCGITGSSPSTMPAPCLATQIGWRPIPCRNLARTSWISTHHPQKVMDLLVQSSPSPNWRGNCGAQH